LSGLRILPSANLICPDESRYCVPDDVVRGLVVEQLHISITKNPINMVWYMIFIKKECAGNAVPVNVGGCAFCAQKNSNQVNSDWLMRARKD